MRRYSVSDAMWQEIKVVFPQRGTVVNNRKFFDAVLWVAKSGAPWRDLPERFGKWNSVYQRFHRLSKAGLWQKVLPSVKKQIYKDCSWTPPPSGFTNRQRERLKKGAQSIGRSRGGLSSKLHLAVTGQGREVKMLVSEGHRADLGFAEPLLQNLHPNIVVADRGYDFDVVLTMIEQAGATAVIPCKSNRKVQRGTNWQVYKHRNVIERYINKLKQFRRVATRYNKTDSNYMSFVCVAASFINSKVTVNTT